MSFFRSEAVDHQKQRLGGQVAIRTPRIGWVVSGLIGVLCAIAILLVTFGSYRPLIRATGTIEHATDSITVRARATGTVTHVKGEPGTRIKPGDVLARLHSAAAADLTDTAFADYIRSRRQSAADLEEVMSLLKKERRSLLQAHEAGERSFAAVRRTVQTELDARERSLAGAASVAERFMLAEQDGASSTLEVNNAEQVRLAASVAVAEARGRLARIKGDAEAARLELEAAIAGLDRDILSAKRERRDTLQEVEDAIDRRDSVITAPVEGRIATVNLTQGQSVRAGDIAFNLVEVGSSDGEPVRVGFLLKERQVLDVSVGQPVLVAFAALPQTRLNRLEGRVVEVSRYSEEVFRVVDDPDLGVHNHDQDIAEIMFEVVVEVNDGAIGRGDETHRIGALPLGASANVWLPLSYQPIWHLLLPSART